MEVITSSARLHLKQYIQDTTSHEKARSTDPYTDTHRSHPTHVMLSLRGGGHTCTHTSAGHVHACQVRSLACRPDAKRVTDVSHAC